MEKLRGYQIKESVTKKCWGLSSIILSEYDHEVLAHPWGEYNCVFLGFKEIFEDEFYRELVELSGLMRAVLDANQESIDDLDKEVVGTLFKEGEEVEGLTYRESCNKIIHANKYMVDLRRSSTHPLDNGKDGYNDSEITDYKNPYVITEGSHRRKDWKSEIDFLKFINLTIDFSHI